MKKKYKSDAINKIVIILFSNFFIFLIISILLGGDGLNGYEENGNYYVSAQGIDTEVNSVIFHFSKYHAVFTVTSFIVALFLMLINRKK